MSASNYLENKILDHVLKNTAYSQPSALYLALFTTDPSEDGSGTEVSGNAYERQTIAFNTASNGTTSNSSDVLFPVATGSWGTIAYVGIYDASTSGNFLFGGQLGTSQQVSTNNQLVFRAGQLTISLD